MKIRKSQYRFWLYAGVLAVFLIIVITANFLSKNKLNCENDSGCVVFGQDGDCNCGCFNKDYKWEKEEDCFCAAPKSCKCINNKCEGVFGEDLTIETKNGENFSVILEANLTTGYEWMVDFDSAYVELIDKKYVPVFPELIGSGGEEIFEFLAKKSGTIEITFFYSRPWESIQPIEKRGYEIIIK